MSYRSIPRILTLIDKKTDATVGWIPHFTSVINWTLRLGLGLLNQVSPRNEAWAAIMDHSIDIGTKKVLVVLRISLNILSNKKSAITLNDCECIGLSVSETINGETVSRDLAAIFTQAGNPAVIIKDCDSTLQKGVRLYAQKQAIDLPVIDDIGHVVARALQAEYEKSENYTTFVSLLGKGASRLRQTQLAFLVPPKLRVKGRFQSIGKLGKWGLKMLQTLDFIGPVENNSSLEKLRNIFAELPKLTEFINDFSHTCQVTSSLMKSLKNEGLNPNTHTHCHQLLETLPKGSTVKTRLYDWLQRHHTIQQQFSSVSLPVSSDIIESLFGRFKHVIERSPQADMNRTTLLIPSLCGKRDEESTMNTLKQVPHTELKYWDENNIPYTLRRQRQHYLANNSIHILGK